MSWQQNIVAGGATARAYTEYADERIASLTKVCLSGQSSIEQIREAQAGIAELLRLKKLPERLADERRVKGE